MKPLAILSLGLLLLGGDVFSQTLVQPGQRLTPTLEPVAETKLVMAGLANANFRGLERILRDPPKDDRAWVFARGQALLIAETGNLLMMRPPRNQGEAAWFEKATDLRSKAAQLGKTLALKDFQTSRSEFVNLANSCNRCHQQFRIQVQIEPFAEGNEP
jgi:hypothetical protein